MSEKEPDLRWKFQRDAARQEKRQQRKEARAAANPKRRRPQIEKGKVHGNAKLSAWLVRNIQAYYHIGELTVDQIMELASVKASGIGVKAVKDILDLKTWKNV
jgi:5-formyltetrahydrofolate cyclo-ligase